MSTTDETPGVSAGRATAPPPPPVPASKLKLLFGRRAMKGRLTKLANYLEMVKGWDTTLVTRKTIIDLETRVQTLLDLQTSFNELMNDIDSVLNTTAEQDANDTERDTFNDYMYEVLADYKHFIELNTVETRSESVPERPQSSNSPQLPRQIIPDIKLPTIQLPRFDGSYDKWTEFNDIYGALIHNNATLSDIQKFYYLKSALSGDAVNIIQSVEVSAINYPIAWQLISDRFKNLNIIVNNYVKALFELPALAKESVTGLRHLHDSVLKNTRCLKALNQPTDQWDTLLVYLVTSKLDMTTKRDWQQERSKGHELAKFEELITFLTRKCAVLESLSTDVKPWEWRSSGQGNAKTQYTNAYGQGNAKTPYTNAHGQGNSKTQYTNAYGQANTTVNNNARMRSTYLSVDRTCVYCKQPMHPLYFCTTFKQLPVYQRISEVKRLNLCFNCLSNSHYTNKCKSIHCRKCNGLHHTILHYDNTTTDEQSTTQFNNSIQSQATIRNAATTANTKKDSIATATNDDGNSDQCIFSNLAFSSHTSEVLLSTALINVKGSDGSYHSCRVVLDPGSQSHFISEHYCKRLNLPIFKSNTNLSGINNSKSQSTSETSVIFKSNTTDYNGSINCLLVPTVTHDLPRQTFDKDKVHFPKNIRLADPYFNRSQPIDMLIGAELYLSLLCVGQITLNDYGLTLQKTKLGWILGGLVGHSNSDRQATNHSTTCINTLEKLVQRFWEIDSLPSTKLLNPDELVCEQHFCKNTFQNEEGRFVVKIPFKDNVTDLGNSRKIAENRFYALERKLNNHQDLKIAYSDFIHEYIRLNHMTRVTDDLTSNKLTYYMPHHPVVKADSLTTKTRVVFDASCSTDKGNSLNSLQLAGALQQDELYSILLRFRQHRFVMIADIEKMYRQILINPADRSFQRVLWRDNVDDELLVYELNTVTYGTTSAPFLATRCLTQLAEQFKLTFPIESEIILHDFYVDDLLTGSNSTEELCQIKTNLIRICDSAKFPLRKWLSNNTQVNTTDTTHETKFFNLADTLPSKTLGLIWNAKDDTLQCANSLTVLKVNAVNKRQILSYTAQLFDPLGIFTPAIIIAKMIIQTLWNLKLAWDESVPQEMFLKWTKFRNQIQCISEIKIPRWVLQPNFEICELHGFSDASTRAYGACVYVRSIDSNNIVTVNLLTSKSRVAPLKQVTLPRLELCAAVLLSHLMERVTSSLNMNFKGIYYWSDSTITLCWINSDSNRWKTFVSNRVADIQRLTKVANWHHVKTCENPADYITRGVWPEELNSLKCWWYGPDWLSKTDLYFPNLHSITNNNTFDDSEMRQISLLNTEVTFNLLERYSTFNKLIRVTAFCLRFIKNCKSKQPDRVTNYLRGSELRNATNYIVRLIQLQDFSNEIKLLKKGDELPNKTLLSGLSLFLDEMGILRVGGRLKQSKFSYDKRHPMLLSGKHFVTRLIAEQEHLRLYHCGPQELLYSLRERFWPTSGRCLTRRVVRGCVQCFKAKPHIQQPKMGDLPTVRTMQSIPFTVSGIDYAGPLLIRDRKGRGYKVVKIYVCIFVCFATKAVHLELVDDLTSDAFIATFRRFAARRGKPTDVYSDNATNFVGADAELARLADFLKTENDVICARLSNIEVNWHFIPPRSPHFGGLWEAAVKSTKHHLKRVLGNSLITYIELLTIVVQIEAILNSRPLTVLNNDPNDPQPLTPAHFLIGKPLTTLADTDFSHVPTNRLGAYQQQQNIIQGFWKRWNKEYISSLQTRTKWKKEAKDKLEIGDVVLLKEENIPPLKWKLGRVTQLHPGIDDITRVATVRCGQTTFKRALAKLCALPKND